MLIIISIDCCTLYTIHYNRKILSLFRFLFPDLQMLVSELGRTNQKKPEAKEIRFFIQVSFFGYLPKNPGIVGNPNRRMSPVNVSVQESYPALLLQIPGFRAPFLETIPVPDFRIDFEG